MPTLKAYGTCSSSSTLSRPTRGHGSNRCPYVLPSSLTPTRWAWTILRGNGGTAPARRWLAGFFAPMLTRTGCLFSRCETPRQALAIEAGEIRTYDGGRLLRIDGVWEVLECGDYNDADVALKVLRKVN